MESCEESEQVFLAKNVHCFTVLKEETYGALFSFTLWPNYIALEVERELKVSVNQG